MNEEHPPIRGEDGTIEQIWLQCRLCKGSGITTAPVRLLFEPRPETGNWNPVAPHMCHQCDGGGGRYVRVEVA